MHAFPSCPSKSRLAASCLAPLFPVKEDHQFEPAALSSDASSEIEMRILDFLEEKGVEFKSPWEKVHEYWDKQKKRRFSETEIEESSKEFSFSRGQGLTLNSKLYCKRVKTQGKPGFQSP